MAECRLPEDVACELPEAIVRIEANQEAMSRVVEKIDRKLTGNGGPGLCVRVDRMEQRQVWEDRTSNRVAKVVVNVVGGVLTAVIIMIVIHLRSGP